MSELSGCWEKLSRAEELIKALEREVDSVHSKEYLEFQIGGKDG